MTSGKLHLAPVDIQLQACLADPDDVSEYRFLVGGKDIKYITIEPGVIPAEDISFAPALKSSLPIFPPGDWNEGHVVKDPSTGNAVFATTIRRDFPGVKNVWHDTQVDHLQLTWLSRMRQNVRLVTCPLFAEPVVYKFAEFPWQTFMLEAETTAYNWIHDHGVGPRFLGHVTEARRVIGFLIENIPGRTADVGDLDLCQRALKKVHALHLKHGDTNKHNFLIKEGDGEAVLIDFDHTTKCHDEQELLEEFEGLQDQLEENTGRGGVDVSSPSGCTAVVGG
ncbi:alpha-galactosidase a precursor [Cucurbitaria berberidis CBS 394.84]|uniref:Alpha-galactosidase a n=1 Tax=Cucurbitaria berberidis CBS 394.84 TaxID=1168544 RepID=A0A9P4L3D5_9PLEO|nr:alpha-galactosidase a precursor [Cucurbitaria berberidis CBS 394.84]KAF1840260.1 alpha-galactosidase a precursor [Cucurbitaria berberidis CBS 394.84]